MPVKSRYPIPRQGAAVIRVVRLDNLAIRISKASRQQRLMLPAKTSAPYVAWPLEGGLANSRLLRCALGRRRGVVVVPVVTMPVVTMPRMPVVMPAMVPMVMMGRGGLGGRGRSLRIFSESRRGREANGENCGGHQIFHHN
jgi:hypothetical protein